MQNTSNHYLLYISHSDYRSSPYSPPYDTSRSSPYSPSYDTARSSPYSPPYDTSSPHSLSCSTSSHGSPPIPADNSHFSPYMSPEATMSNLQPPPPLPTTTCTSIPYSTDNGCQIYMGVPINSSEYYTGTPSVPQLWETSTLPCFDTFGQIEQTHIHHLNPHQALDGEVPINIIDQSGVPMEPEMMTATKYFTERLLMDGQHAAAAEYQHDMMHMHPKMTGAVCLPPVPHSPFVTNKQKSEKLTE